MKIIKFSLIFFFTFTFCHKFVAAQSVSDFLWVNKGGGSKKDRGEDVTTDNSGNIIVTGHFAGTATFGNKSITSSGNSRDMFVARYNRNGSILWIKKGSGSGEVRGNGVDTDASGNIYVTGSFAGPTSFGSFNINTAGAEDIFIVKYDSSGNVQWVKNGGGSKGDWPSSLAVDASGNVYITGQIQSIVNFGSTQLTSAGDKDIFIVKYNSNGSLQWAKRAGGIREDSGKDITFHGSNILITGYFQDTAGFSSTNITSAGDFDIFIASYSSSGNVNWVKRYGGSGEDRGKAITVDPSSRIFLAGNFNGTMTIGSDNLNSNGNNEGYVAKLDPSGNAVWGELMKGVNGGEQFGITTADGFQKDVIVTGSYSGTGNFGGTIVTSQGKNDIFVVGYQRTDRPSGGVLNWVKSAGGSGEDYGDRIRNDTFDGIVVTGRFSGSSARFDSFTLQSSGQTDVFIARIGAVPGSPNSLAATTVSGSQINLNWQDNSANEVGFKLERRVGQSGSFTQIAQLSANTVSYQDIGLNSNTEYCYRVLAFNSAGNSPYSNTPCATTPDVAPNPPTNLTASTVSKSRINLSWQDNSTNENGFRVERRVGQGGSFIEIAVVSANVVSYQDTGLVVNTEFCYQVRAYNSVSPSNYSNIACATTQDVPPTAPGNLAAVAISNSQVNLTWKDNSANENTFHVERRTGQAGSFQEVVVLGQNVVSYLDTGLVANTEYCYRVRGSNSIGASEFSNIACSSTQDVAPNPPTNLDATRVSTSQIDLTWLDNSTNEEGFKLERRIGQSGAFQLIANLSVNSVNYQDTGLQVDTEYCYRVLAFNSPGNSPYSNIACATTSTQKGPVAEFSGSTQAGQAPLTVSFSDASTAGDTVITNWSWDFQDDGVADSNQQNPTHTFADTGSYTIRLSVTDANGLTDTEVKQNYIVVTGAAIDTEPPAIQPPTASSASAGNSVTITSTITDISTIATVEVNFRRGGETAFQKLSMTLAGADSWQGEIPANFVTDRGLEYFISARDAAGNETQTNLTAIRVAVPNISSSFPANSYRFISLPVQTNDLRPLTIFSDISSGTYDRAKWRLFTTASSQTNLSNPRRPYLEFQIDNNFNLEVGRAYWLIVKDSYQINTGTGTSVNTVNSFVKSLVPGWNFIATPFNFSTPLTKVRLESGASLDGRLWSYTGSNFIPLSSSSSMQPFSGYALQVENQDRLFIEMNSSVTSQPQENQLASARDEWAIRVKAEVLGYEDTYNFAAVANTALPGWDQFDNPEPPVIGDYVSVYFPHPEWQKLSVFYCADVRPFSAEEGEVWEFEVVSNLQDRINLSFEGLEEIPYNLDIHLVDEVVKVSQDLRKNSFYSIASRGESFPKRLKLVVAKNNKLDQNVSSLPEEFGLGQNYPNPFNPSTTIRYGLPEASVVTLTIYNLLGETLAVLINGEFKNAGYNVAVWDGRDKTGKLVSSGLYLYQLRVGGKSITRKMAFMK